ncbi:MAG: hypothetical protein M1272_07855 [Firmicutes bacterium]|nr:hypothetical protein [Bacillota bacterium]
MQKITHTATLTLDRDTLVHYNQLLRHRLPDAKPSVHTIIAAWTIPFPTKPGFEARISITNEPLHPAPMVPYPSVQSGLFDRGALIATSEACGRLDGDYQFSAGEENFCIVISTVPDRYQHVLTIAGAYAAMEPFTAAIHAGHEPYQQKGHPTCETLGHIVSVLVGESPPHHAHHQWALDPAVRNRPPIVDIWDEGYNVVEGWELYYYFTTDDPLPPDLIARAHRAWPDLTLELIAYDRYTATLTTCATDNPVFQGPEVIDPDGDTSRFRSLLGRVNPPDPEDVWWPMYAPPILDELPI